MDISIFLAQIFAVVYLAVGLGMLLNKAYYFKAMGAMLKDSNILYLGGLMAIVAGFLIVTYHNIWVQDWMVVITILGWLALIKGIVFLVFPAKADMLKDLYKKQSNMNIICIIALALGAFLGYYGFFA